MKDAAPIKRSWEWLAQRPGLDELRAEFPEEWPTVARELERLGRRGLGEMQAVLEQSSRQEAMLTAAPGGGRRGRRGQDELVRPLVRLRMLQLALRQHCVAVASGVKEGKVRFNLINGLLAQKLLFAQGLERKPVSLFWFRLLWPLLWQRRRLMPLVQPQGIYCFYSQPLLDRLVELIAGRPCLEIAAGDGTLSRLLAARGVTITATDDQSWGHAIHYPATVLKKEAREALALYQPRVVLCSWPPPGNTFERQVFKSRGVDLYIVVGSRHRHAAGNWTDYEGQSAFSWAEEVRLSHLVLPPELDSAVFLFRRKEEEAAGEKD